jgi:type I restriction enzyme R subunit
MCLRISYRLAIWFYRLVKKEFDFAAPVFVLPTSGQGNDYAQELESLKEALKLAQQHETQTKEEFELQQAKLASLAGYISILESKQEETEEQSKARIAALEVKLQEKEAELKQKTEAERNAYKQQVKDAVATRSLELSESETRYLIDSQLRKAGWDADTQNLTFAKGVRPQKGRNIAIAEWPTGKDETGKPGFADYVLFAGLIPVGVVEAKKANTDVSAKLSEAYRYSKYFDVSFLRHELEQAAKDDEQMQHIADIFKAILPITLRRATPASDPYFPPAANACNAAFVSSNDTFESLACMPACLSAADICGTSAAPHFAPAAITFIMRDIS